MYKNIYELVWLVFVFGIIISCVFWILEYRNRALWQACLTTGKEFEEQYGLKMGIYTSLNNIPHKGLTHSLAIDFLFLVTTIIMIILIIFFKAGKI